jgi:site-specific recombinase XerC
MVSRTSFIMHDIPGQGATLEPTTTQLPATIQQAEVTSDLRSPNVVPAIIADLGDQAGWRYVEFFTAKIRNPHTRRAYAGRAENSLPGANVAALTPTSIRPHDVGSYIEQLQTMRSAPSVKQQLAAVRMLFDWLVVVQIVPGNPASAVRGPKHVVKTGTTPVLEGEEWRRLLDAIPTTTLRDLRDRALIATLTYSFARATAALKMKIEDLRPRGAGWTIRLHEKGGKHHLMPATTHSPRRCMPISIRPASPRTARALYSAPPAATTAMYYPINPWTSLPPGE